MLPHQSWRSRTALPDVRGVRAVNAILRLPAWHAQSRATCDAAIWKLQCLGVQNDALHRRLAWGWSALAENSASRH